jgi:hypothetical protein
MTEPTMESLKAENECLRTVLDDLLQEKGLGERMGRLRFELRVIAYMVNDIIIRMPSSATILGYSLPELRVLLHMLAGRIAKAEQELPPETRSSTPAASKRDLERAAFGWMTDAVRFE